jgi:tetratricopeptide (TPR) repeat protein
MPGSRRFFPTLILPVLAFLVGAPLMALEVSEVTVDFPLSEVFEIQEQTEGDTTAAGQIDTGPLKTSRSPWEDDWFAYRQNILRGNFESAEKNIGEVLEYKRERSIPNLYVPSSALLVEASIARGQGRYDDSLQLISYSSLLAPDSPAPYFHRAKTIWEQNQLRALSALDAVLEGFGVFFRDFRSFFPWSLGLTLRILLALAISSFLVIFLSAFRVVPRIAHDLSHLVKVPQWLWYIAFPIVLGAVLVSGLPFTLWTVLIALLMVFHLKGSERIAVGTSLVLMISIPLFLQVLTLSNVYFSDSVPLTVYQAERGGEGSRTLDDLHRLRIRDPQNSQILAAMAVVLKRSGNFREAEALLLQAMEMEPDSPAYLNNLGNVYMNTGSIDQAIEVYRQALRYKDDHRIHYNLSQALRENLQLEEGEKEFRIAQQMAPALAGELMDLQEESSRRITVDIYHDTSLFLRGALVLAPEGRGFRDRIWTGIVPWVPFGGSWFLFLGAGVLLFGGHVFDGAVSMSRRCRRCNRMHCPKCSQSSSDVLCAQCRQIFVVRSGVDPASRVKKMMQIMRFNKRRAMISRIATVLLPGMGHVYLGAGWQALVLIAVSTLFWAKWVFWYGFFRSTTSLEIQTGLVSRIVFGIFLVLFYLFALKKVSERLEEK